MAVPGGHACTVSVRLQVCFADCGVSGVWEGEAHRAQVPSGLAGGFQRPGTKASTSDNMDMRVKGSETLRVPCEKTQ